MKQLRRKLHGVQRGLQGEARVETLLDLTECFSALAMVGSFLTLVAVCLATL